MMRWPRRDKTGTQKSLGIWTHSSTSKLDSCMDQGRNNQVPKGGTRHAYINQLTTGYEKTLLKQVYHGHNWSAEGLGRSKTRNR
jgi:hypothetical protein